MWYKSVMAETTEPGVLETPKKRRDIPGGAPRRKIHVSDIIIFAVIIIVIIGLAVFLYNHLVLKRDVSNAQKISDQTIADIQKRDGAAAWKLGDKPFQAKNSATDLTNLFKQEEIATLKPPTLDRTIAFTSKRGRTVFFIYKYSALKVPFYIRTGIMHEGPHWYLTNLAGNADESQLTIQ